MVMALPFVFAGLGGVIGASVGFTTAGISIGWLVGSWIMGPLNAKNNIFDPGAQELPKINQSLRGVTMPVLFGTNLVSSNIVWQNNFHYIKKTSGGGGKGGGSGGGGKGGAKTVSYEYLIDIVYHLGMPYVPGELFKIWSFNNLIDKKSLDNFLTDISGTNSLDVSSGKSFRTSNPGTSRSSNTSSVGPKLKYREAAYFPGNHPEVGSWAYMDGVMGNHIVWPGTAWVGFKDLSMGASPQIPLLTFELGPAETSIEEVLSDGWVTGDLTNNRQFVGPGIKDAFRNIWVMSEHGEENPTATASCYSNAGSLLSSTTLSDLHIARRADWWDATFGYAVHSVGNHNAFISGDGTRLVVLTHAQGTFSNPQTGFQFFHIYLIGSDGSLTATGGVVQASTGDQPNVHGIGQACFGQVGYGTNDDAIFYFGSNASLGELTLIFAPSINEMEGVSLKGLKCNRYLYVSTGLGNIYQFFPWYSNPATYLPKVSSSTALVEYWRFYSYFGKQYVAEQYVPAGGTWQDATFDPAAPSGALIYFEFPVTDFTFVSGATSTTVTGSLSAPVICTDVLTDSTGATFTFFSDDQTDFTTGGAQTLNNYAPNISAQLYTSDPISINVAFHMSFETDSAWTATEKPIRVRIKGFLYNAITGDFAYQYSADTNGGDLIDTYGGTNQTLLNLTQSVLLTDDDTLTYMLFTSSASPAILPNRVLKIGIAEINYGSQIDLYPPLIIKEVLTHALFGLFPGEDIIDETTYNSAYAYCVANDIKVSTQYRREETGQNIFELLLATYGGWLVVDAATNKIKFGVSDLSPGVVRTIDNNHLVRTDQEKPPIKTTKGAAQDTYNLIRVNFIDRNLDYVQNQIEEGDEVDQDLNGLRLREFPPVFVMSERLARRIALRALWSNLYPRDTHAFTLGFKDADLEPGDIITLVDSFSNINQICQIVKWEENVRGQFDVLAHQQFLNIPSLIPANVTSAQWDFVNNWDLSSSYTSITSAYAFERTGAPNGLDYVKAFELPLEYESGSSPRIRVGWLPKGPSRGASIYVSPDGTTYASRGYNDIGPIGGRLLTALDANPLVPMVESVNVVLHPATEYSANSPVFYFNETLPEVTQSAMHVGMGNIWVGSEMLAYSGVSLVSQNTYRLDRVYRGWGGTVIGAHSSWDFFFRRDEGMFMYEYSAEDIGTTMHFKVVPVGFDGTEFDISSVTGVAYTVTGKGYRPQLPANIQVGSMRGVTAFNVGSAADLTVYWHDSAAVSGWGAGGYGTNPGGYGGYISDVSSLGYFVSVVGSGGTVVRSTYVSTPAYTYTNSQNFADNGAWRGNVAIKVLPTAPYGNAELTRVISLGVFF